MVTQVLEKATPEERLPTPQTASEFSFPIATPYPIQLDFMQRLFETIERREFAIFESPTGTGKSLSIICGALTWLKHDSERKARTAPTAASSTAVTDDDQRPDWVVAYEKKQQLDAGNAAGSDENDAQQKYLRWVANTRRREAAERKKGLMASRRGVPTASKAESNKRKTDEGGNGSDDEVVVVEAYYSGDEDAQQKPSNGLDDDGQVHYSAEVRKLLERRAGNRPLYDSSDDSDNDDSSDSAVPPKEPSITKVIYASRTHSQLQQFVNEIKRTQFASADKVKCVTLGSRMQLCVNERARQGAQSVHAINERCLEMQTAGSKKSARCGYLPLQHTLMLDFKDATGSAIMDIEELAKEGRRRCTCPYYGARASVNGAHVVALPYNTLLSRSARQAMGISLAGNVVVIDEAHNLVDTILAIHSISLDLRTVKALQEMVQMYFTKYWRRLKGSNVTYIRQTTALLKALSKFMQTIADGTTRVVSVNEFLTMAHADHINVYKIDRYLRESKLGRKLNMFSDRLVQKDSDVPSKRPTATVRETVAGPAPATAVAAFEAFMECLGKPDRTGSRLIIRATSSSKSGVEVELKYLQLDPSEAFGEICSEARAVVLAGGTMKPANDVVEQLLPSQSEPQSTPLDLKLDPANARLFAWSHVVDRSHICSVVVGSGPTGAALRFAHGDQGDPAKLREAGLALAALCQVTPGGVVAFFPSYALLDRMHRNWTSAGIVDRISKRKPVFVESSTSSGDVLELYSARVKAAGSTGALLLSVVGGRLSEGINFSDELGRAVVMVGVPFPSLASPELAERLAYYEGMAGAPSATSGVIGSMGPRARELYESLCMRAVNQSIGRAIRHRNDYAAIVLLDARYAEPRIARKLPAWIVGSAGPTATASAFGPALAQVASFFKREFA
ncbi:ATP-dependent DNA helicase chl1 [Coemansia sp. RSA 2671]|nr:ATP-dependent DNA helicase chl1 [Coemansia sp. RSA 2671]